MQKIKGKYVDNITNAIKEEENEDSNSYESDDFFAPNNFNKKNKNNADSSDGSNSPTSNQKNLKNRQRENALSLKNRGKADDA